MANFVVTLILRDSKFILLNYNREEDLFMRILLWWSFYEKDLCYVLHKPKVTTTRRGRCAPSWGVGLTKPALARLYYNNLKIDLIMETYKCGYTK